MLSEEIHLGRRYFSRLAALILEIFEVYTDAQIGIRFNPVALIRPLVIFIEREYGGKEGIVLNVPFQHLDGVFPMLKTISGLVKSCRGNRPHQGLGSRAER